MIQAFFKLKGQINALYKTAPKINVFRIAQQHITAQTLSAFRLQAHWSFTRTTDQTLTH